jgi:hypothetical protein
MDRYYTIEEVAPNIYDTVRIHRDLNNYISKEQLINEKKINDKLPSTQITPYLNIQMSWSTISGSFFIIEVILTYPQILIYNKPLYDSYLDSEEIYPPFMTYLEALLEFDKWVGYYTESLDSDSDDDAY